MVAAHSQSRLYHGNGEGLTTIAKISHISRLGQEELTGRLFAIGRYQLVEMVLYELKV